jgi:hypothetical protein
MVQHGVSPAVGLIVVDRDPEPIVAHALLAVARESDLASQRDATPKAILERAE